LNEEFDAYNYALYDQFARIGKAVGNGRRLLLLECLAQGERSVDSLAQASGLSVANTSQHLQQLREAGLVVARKDGQRVFYQLACDDVVSLTRLVAGIAHRQIDEVDRLVRAYLETRDSLEPLDAENLLERTRAGVVTILDVRPREEYLAGHIEGAINIPISELQKRMGDIPSTEDVIAYCRGPYCIMSYEAVAMLRNEGFSARRLEFGFPQWKSAGYPIEMGIH